MHFDTLITMFTRCHVVSAASWAHLNTMCAFCQLREFLRPEDKDSARRLIENLNPSSVVNAVNVDLAKLPKDQPRD